MEDVRVINVMVKIEIHITDSIIVIPACAGRPREGQGVWRIAYGVSWKCDFSFWISPSILHTPYLLDVICEIPLLAHDNRQSRCSGNADVVLRNRGIPVCRNRDCVCFRRNIAEKRLPALVCRQCRVISCLEQPDGSSLDKNTGALYIHEQRVGCVRSEIEGGVSGRTRIQSFGLRIARG